MTKKIVYKKNDLLGENPYRSDAIRDILEKDKKYHVLNNPKEKKELFILLKKYRENGVTEEELKKVLATLKYGEGDAFTSEEVNQLAQELDLAPIEKRHLDL